MLDVSITHPILIQINISCLTFVRDREKSITKPDVCQAKYAKQYVTSKVVQIQKGTEGKHYTNPAFERRSTQNYKQLFNQIKRRANSKKKPWGRENYRNGTEANG